VRQPLLREPNSHLYDYDLDEHILTLSSWSHEISTYSIDFQENMEISSILINGEGSYFVRVLELWFISDAAHLFTVFTKCNSQMVSTYQCLYKARDITLKQATGAFLFPAILSQNHSYIIHYIRFSKRLVKYNI
jgi:hypothetical protein